MKFKEFINKHAKLYMIASMIILLGAVGITYAYYAATVSNTTAVTGQAGGGVAPTLSVDLVSDDATGNLIPIDMNTDILTKAASASNKCVDNNGYSVCQIYSVTVTNNSDLAQSYYISLSNLYGENTPNVDAVSMGNSNSTVADATSIKGTGNICTTNSVGNGETTTACYFMVVIKNLNDVQTDNGTFGGTVTATSTTGGEVKADFGDSAPTLIQHITSLYVENYDSTKNVQFADNTGMNYYAPNARLMNDGLDITGDMVSETAAANGTAGNIRYYGAGDSNLKNYIYFNCSDYSNQSSSTCETWRILGIIDGKVKLIRNESIGKYVYNYETFDQTTGFPKYSADWNTSEINEVLSEGGTYYSGLQEKNSKTIELISESTWYRNAIGYSSSESESKYANTAYIERTGSITLSEKIALASLSDYGYAVDLSSCQYKFKGYSEPVCTSTNWLTSMFTTDSEYWLLSIAGYAPNGSAWFVESSYKLGYVWSTLPSSKCGVIPVLYLAPTLGIDPNTDGSSTNPYKLIVD